MKRRFLFPLAAAGVMASGLAAAQSDWRMDGFTGYVGASAGQSHFRNDCSSVFDCDRKDTAWKAYFGGSVSHIIGLEFGYTDFGRMRSFGGDTEAKATSVSLTAGVPLGDRFAIFAKGGGAYGRTDVSAAASTFVSTGRKSGWGSTWGAGGSFAITKSLAARVDWDRYKLDFVGGKRDVDLLSAGLQARF